LPDPRFTLNVNDAEDLNGNQECDGNEICNGTVIDNLTGLVWMQNVDCFGALTLSDATATPHWLAKAASVVWQAEAKRVAGAYRTYLKPLVWWIFPKCFRLQRSPRKIRLPI
ncbi:MAG: hypothetical protein ACI8UP_005365, partial [Porticoccaceae bacterium]